MTWSRDDNACEIDSPEQLIRSKSKPNAGRSGWLYVLSGNHRPDIKIGSSKLLDGRVKTLAVEQEAPLTTEALWCMPDCRTAERDMHRALSEWRTEGEWYLITPEQAIDIATDLGLGAFWVER